MRIRDLIEHLQTYDPDDPVAAGIWLAADVEGCAAQLGVTLGEDDVAGILDAIHDDHDANLGITCHTLEFHIGAYRED